jgi:hypothetical protein
MTEKDWHKEIDNDFKKAGLMFAILTLILVILGGLAVFLT